VSKIQIVFKESSEIMKLKKLLIGVFFLPLSGVFYGCASNASSSSAPTSTEASSKAEKKVSTVDNSKAEKKISMAIGQELGDFTIADQQKVDAPAGYDGTQYTVKTKTGKTFKCEILEASGFGKAMTFGMATGAGAMCTDFTKGSKDAGKTNKASCNALLQAAGKC
jgi:zona occludens toxin (predicted ATPase)